MHPLLDSHTQMLKVDHIIHLTKSIMLLHTKLARLKRTRNTVTYSRSS